MTLELAIAGTPMVVAYKVDRVAVQLRHLVKVHSIVLANLVAESNTFPEYIQEQCNGDVLAAAVAEVMAETPVRAAQLRTLAEIPGKLMLPAGTPILTASSSRVSAVRQSPAAVYRSGSTIDTLVALTGGRPPSVSS